MQTLLYTLIMLSLVFCKTLEATSTDSLMTKDHQITNVWVIDEDKDGRPEGLMIELCLDGKFDKILVFNEIGFYIGRIVYLKDKPVFIDLNGQITPIETTPQTPKTPLKQT